jgi:toxin ParE1/3/4
MKLILTVAALEDLRSIRAYTLEAWDEAQEERYLDRLWTRFEILQANPERYRLRSDLFPGCRIAAEGRHVILFRADEGVLKIVRVLHVAMDFKRPITPGDEW